MPSFGQAQAPGVRRQQSHPASIGQPPSVQPRRDSSTSSSSPAAWTATMALSPPLIQAPSPLAFSSAASKSSFCTSAKQFVALFQLEPPLHASTLNIAMEAIRQEWIDKARLFHSFKRCQVGATSRVHLVWYAIVGLFQLLTQQRLCPRDNWNLIYNTNKWFWGSMYYIIFNQEDGIQFVVCLTINRDIH